MSTRRDKDMNKGSLKSNKPRRVLFVLGSGVSSGICPNVEDLTNTVLNPDPKWFSYDIVKLHGGCDWIFAGDSGEGPKHNYRWVKNLTDKKMVDCKDRSGRALCDSLASYPTLTGTTNKAAAYTEGIHAELFGITQNLLSDYSHIICSGYGWKDAGFNTMIRDWAVKQHWHEDQRRYPRLLLLHSGDRLGEFRHTNNPQRPRRNLWFWPNCWEKNLSEPWKPDHLDWMRCHPQWLSCTRLEDISNLFADRA